MRNPPRSCDLHGGFFAPCALPKPLPLGEVSPKVTERASPAGKSRCAAIGRLFVRAILSLCLGFAVSGLALSVSSQAPRQLPQRGSHWHVGQASLRTTSQSASQTAPLVGEPLAKRRSFPLCQGLPSVGEVARRRRDGEVELLSLWESWREAPERATVNLWKMHD